MIKDPPAITMSRNFARPAPGQVESLRGALTGHLADAMGGKGALDGRIKPIAGLPQSFCGVAVTCDCGPSDNLALFAALDAVRPGDVILAATGDHLASAVTGDLLIGMARNCGASAFVTDGAVRDLAGLRLVGLPIYCAAVSPNSPARNGPGAVGCPVVIGGTAVASGDVVVGDEDGVVVVPLARVADVIRSLEGIRAAEAALEAKVRAGLRLPDFVRTIMDSDRVVSLD